MYHVNDKPFARRVAIVALGVASAVVAERASANAQITVDARTGGSGFTIVTDSGNATSGPGGSASDSAITVGSGTIFSGAAPFPAVGTQTGSAGAFAQASEGLLKARSSAGFATSPLVFNSGVASASATARWSDFFIVNAGAAVSGTSGFVTGLIDVDGGVAGNVLAAGGGDSAASFESIARLIGTGLTPFGAYPSNVLGNCDGWAYCWVEQGDLAASVSFSNFASTISVNIPVIFGSQTSIDYTLDVTSIANAITADLGVSASGTGSSDFSSTLEWAGITGVFDASGNRITDFAVTSQSGFDYVARDTEVPLPSTLWCLAIGGWGLVRRKRCPPRS